MPHLEVLLLGHPRAEVDGAPIEVDTRKAIALLAYLAVTGERHSRDVLANLLWPDYDAEHARAALRRTLSALNKSLGGRWLAAERASVGFNREGVRVDVREFRRFLNEERLAEAVALYRGDFLAGFGLRDSVNFDDWQFFEAEGLRRDLAGALERLAQAHASRGELEPAIDCARRWLGLDALQEPAHRALMQLYAWSGQRPAALRQYRECVRILDRELGVAPLEETTELYRAIKEDRAPPPEERAAPASPLPASPSALPLVGRAAERDSLLRAYDRAASDGCLVVLEGEPGIGKSRLAEELLAHVRARGEPALAVRCYEGEANLPYGVIVEALRTAAEGRAGWAEELSPRWLAEAARLTPHLGEGRSDLPAVAPLDTPGAQSGFLEGLGQVLGAACRLLVVDDAHWADEASLDVVTYIVRRLRGRSLCLVLTWRPDEVPPGHRLRRLAAEAAREGVSTVVSLPRLDEGSVMELARSVVPEQGDELGGRLYAETDGVPLFVVAYLAAIAAGESESSLPGGIVELLRSRVGAAGETARQLLVAGAVIGRPFDLDTVREASGRGDDEAVTALEELVRRGLLVEAPEGYEFGHEKVRSLVYEDTSLARRRLLHRRVAEALVARNRRDPAAQASVVAEHYRLAGQEQEAAEQFLLAGERARSLYANAEALSHFESALALGHPDTAALHEALGDLHTLLGSYGAAVASYEAAAAQCEPARLPALEHRLGLVHHRRGEWEVSASHFEAALDGAEDTAFRARVEADRSLNEHRRGRDGEALSLALLALESAEEAGDAQALAQVHNLLGVLASSRGDLDEARRHLEQSLALAEALGDPGARAAALNNLALIARAAGETEPALSLTAAALDLCVTQGDRHREAALHNNLADLLHAEGRGEEAMAHLKQAVAIFAEIGSGAGETQPEIWKLVEW